MLIVPDRHGTGTNALLLTLPDALEPSFGPASCQRHAAHAESSGVAHEVIEVPSLALEVDTPEDCRRCEPRSGPRTAGGARNDVVIAIARSAPQGMHSPELLQTSTTPASGR